MVSEHFTELAPQNPSVIGALVLRIFSHAPTIHISGDLSHSFSVTECFISHLMNAFLSALMT